jgi:17 kDa outer membrane surface antigen
MFGGKGEPVVTGSVAAPVDLQQPLPPTLAYSDANKIGQAAAAALWQADTAASQEWVNNATGSSGTVEENDLGPPQEGECRGFSTIVTSISGVHSYSGDVCRSGGGRPVVRIDERSAADRT